MNATSDALPRENKENAAETARRCRRWVRWSLALAMLACVAGLRTSITRWSAPATPCIPGGNVVYRLEARHGYVSLQRTPDEAEWLAACGAATSDGTVVPPSAVPTLQPSQSVVFTLPKPWRIRMGVATLESAGGGMWSISFNLVVIAPLLLGLSLWAWLPNRRPEQCHVCGYLLIGLPEIAAECPECGHALHKRTLASPTISPS